MTRISRLQIFNYRSIEYLDIEFGNICALIGSNNTGKSNILEIIKRVLEKEWVNAETFKLDDIRFKDDEKDIKIILEFDEPIKYRKFKKSRPVDIWKFSFEYKKYMRGEQKGERHLECKCFKRNDGDIYVDKEAPNNHNTQQTLLLGIPAEAKEMVPLIFIGSHRTLKDQLPSGRNSFLRQMLIDVTKDLENPNNLIDFENKQIQRLEAFRNYLNMAFEVLKTNEFKEIENSIRLNTLKSLGLDPNSVSNNLDVFFTPFNTFEFFKTLEISLNENNYSTNATDLGEGFQNTIIMSIMQTFEERKKKGAIILIEEPEMYLHPHLQRVMFQTLKNLSETNQVIYTTHSPQFVTVPEYFNVIRVSKVEDKTVINGSNDKSNPQLIEKIIKEFDPARNELFFSQKVLLVEGDTERLSFPEYAKRLNIDLDKNNISIIEVGGKRSLEFFAEIVASFDIPFGLVFDSDSSDFDKNNKGKEINLNDRLKSLENKFEKCKIWELEKNYEDILKKTLEDQYCELCNEYQRVNKPSRARLIAANEKTKIPDVFKEIIEWLVTI